MTKATISDVAACFRILLEREPSPEEIVVHAKAHIGNDLADVLKQFLESQEFKGRNIVQITAALSEKPKSLPKTEKVAQQGDGVKSEKSDEGKSTGNRASGEHA